MPYHKIKGEQFDELERWELVDYIEYLQFEIEVQRDMLKSLDRTVTVLTLIVVILTGVLIWQVIQ